MNWEDPGGDLAYVCFDDGFNQIEQPWRYSGGGGVSVATIGLIVGAALVAEAIAEEKKEETLVFADRHTSKSQDSAVYFGADMKGGSWKIVTTAMDFDTAQAWVHTMAIIKGYGKGASWGLYTTKEYDAEKMVVALGGPGPCLHANRPGEYPHFHPTGMILWGQYKHFHVWYGEIYGG